MKYTRERYPDGGIYAKVSDFSDPIITERINSYEDLFFIKSLKDVCDYNNVEVSLFIPCMFQQQHDRRFNDYESFEGKLVADFINSCNFKEVKVFHPHSDVCMALLNRSKVRSNEFFIQKVLADLKVNAENTVLLSSDAGGFKPLIKLADHIEWKGETESASKSRDPQTHKLTQLVGRMDFDGKDILLIDDICVFGGTFLGLAKILKERNAGKLHLGISHLTVPNPNPEIFKAFDKVYTTNSKFDSYSVPDEKGEPSQPKNLTIYKIV